MKPRVRTALWLSLALGWLLPGCARQSPGLATAPPTSPATPAGSATAPIDSPSPTPSPALPAASPAPTLTPVPRAFTIGLAGAPGTLDPANAADEAALLITRHLYEGLTAFEPGGTRPVPALAEAWEVSPDGLEWTFRLRDDVRFSDGTPFTAEAARLNFERWFRATPPGRYLFWRSLFGGFAGEAGPTGEPLSLLAEVRAPAPDELVLRLNRPDAALPNTLALPAFAFVNPAAFAGGSAAALDRASAGTGRYVLGGWPQPDLVLLRRNHAYTGSAEPGPEVLVFKALPDDTQRLLALQTGEIEALARLNPRDFAAVAQPGAGTRLEFDPALNVVYLGFNQARAPWGNVDCRLAVAYALDAARYVQDYFPGDAEVALAMQPPAVWGYSAPGQRTHDPDAARQHWQACVAAGASVPAEVTLYVPPVERAYLPDPAGMGRAIQADLAATLGLTVTIASPDWQTAWLPDVRSGRADLFLLGWTGVNGDPDSFLCPLFCGLDSAFNSSAEGEPLPPDAELAGLLQQARAAPDLPEREALYAQANARLFEAVPAVPIAHRRVAWAFRAGVSGNVPSPIESVFWGLQVK